MSRKSKRSPRLRKLERKFAKLRKTQPIQVGEPKQPPGTGMTIAEFVDTARDMEENYKPSSYFTKNAPKKC